MDDPESWRWIWLVAAVVFGIGEMASPGAFFLAPFAIGALAAAGLAFLDVSTVWEWTAFVGVSLACLFALRPLARRLDRNGDSDGVGARRLIGRPGTVLVAIDAAGRGSVRIDREEWRADGVGPAPIPVGAAVRVTHVEGTRVIVVPTEESPS